METALVKHEPANIIRTMEDAERAARAMAGSGFFQDTKQASQAVVKILAGQELGFGPFASMTGVNIIQNKPVLAANLMAAAVKRTGKYNYRVVKMDDNEVELEFYESGQAVGRSKFTMKDAQAAGLNTKDNWRKYPRNMLFARALSNGQKWYAPDVFNGATVYTPDELGATVNEDGNVIDAPVAPAVAPEPEQPSLTYEQAAAFTSKDRNGREIAFSDMTSTQLTYVMENSKKFNAVEAAKIVLQHDHNLTQNAAEKQNAEQQAAE